MRAPRLRIINDSGIGRDTKIYIDDQDVSACVCNVQVSMTARDAVWVTLEVPMGEVNIDGVEHLRWAKGVVDLLTKHGWTPPAED
ncbi:MAG: hypothetical protein ACRERD_08690 [Candidatus Binatia bacterium]